MMEPHKRSRRWPRSEQFQLSEAGRLAAQSYLDVIVASRAEEGRRSFDDARQGWSTQHGVPAEDGLSLRELVASPLTLSDLSDKLDGCGPDKKQVKEGLERLLEAGLVLPVESTKPPSAW
jgi:hypothetical protein